MDAAAAVAAAASAAQLGDMRNSVIDYVIENSFKLSNIDC